jgi:hypothetical protein
MTSTLHFTTEAIEADGSRHVQLAALRPTRFVIAGWTGRDVAAIEHHIHELEALGVPRPSSVPLYYRAASSLLTQVSAIESLGDRSSGEAEPMLFRHGGEWWLTVASDHTDREVETYSVAVSKQMCAKPVATAAWRWRDVMHFQDELRLCSRILEDGQWTTYQQGALASIRPLAALIEGAFGQAAEDGAFLSCGTLPALPNAAGVGIRPAATMELMLTDLRHQRTITHRYQVQALPIVA